MNSILSSVVTILLGGFFLGLLLYSFYLVLTSKDSKEKSTLDHDMEGKTASKPAK